MMRMKSHLLALCFFSFSSIFRVFASMPAAARHASSVGDAFELIAPPSAASLSSKIVPDEGVKCG